MPRLIPKGFRAGRARSITQTAKGASAGTAGTSGAGGETRLTDTTQRAPTIPSCTLPGRTHSPPYSPGLVASGSTFSLARTLVNDSDDTPPRTRGASGIPRRPLSTYPNGDPEGPLVRPASPGIIEGADATSLLTPPAARSFLNIPRSIPSAVCFYIMSILVEIVQSDEERRAQSRLDAVWWGMLSRHEENENRKRHGQALLSVTGEGEWDADSVGLAQKLLAAHEAGVGTENDSAR